MDFENVSLIDAAPSNQLLVASYYTRALDVSTAEKLDDTCLTLLK